MACSEGVSKEASGEMASGLAVGTRGILRRMVRKGFRRRLRKGIRQGFGMASKGFIGRASGTRVIFRKGSEGVFRAGRFERVSGGGVFRRGYHRWSKDQRLGFLCEIGPRRVEIGPAEVFGAM